MFLFFSLMGNWKLMAPVDIGIFEVYQNENRNTLKYKVSFKRLIIISLVVFIITGFWSSSVKLFLVLVMMHVVFGLIPSWFKHKKYFNKVISELNSIHK